MNEKLSLLLRKLIREELRTELSIFKSDILNEIRKSEAKPIVEQAVRTSSGPKREQLPQRRPQVTQKPKPKPKYSSDPFLQSLLEETQPLSEPASRSDFMRVMRGDDIQDYEIEEVNDLDEIFEVPKPKPQVEVRPRSAPIVTEDINGQPIDTTNPKVKEVVDIMNMDFSAKLKAMEEATKSIRPQF